MEYSLVADHWQCAAMIAPCAAFAGAAWTLGGRLSWRQPAGTLLCLGLLAALAALTWHLSRIYADNKTLLEQTLAGNPDCWMAHDDLGMVLVDRGRIDEALARQ